MTEYEITWIAQGYEGSNMSYQAAEDMLDALLLFKYAMKKKYTVKVTVLSIRIIAEKLHANLTEELNQLITALADEAQVLIADDVAGKYVPATARIATKGVQVVIVIEAEQPPNILRLL